MISILYNLIYGAVLDRKLAAAQALVDNDPAIASHKDLERRIIEVAVEISSIEDLKGKDFDAWEVKRLELEARMKMLEDAQIPLPDESENLLSDLRNLRFDKWVLELKTQAKKSNA